MGQHEFDSPAERVFEEILLPVCSPDFQIRRKALLPAESKDQRLPFFPECDIPYDGAMRAIEPVGDAKDGRQFRNDRLFIRRKIPKALVFRLRVALAVVAG